METYNNLNGDAHFPSSPLRNRKLLNRNELSREENTTIFDISTAYSLNNNNNKPRLSEEISDAKSSREYLDNNKNPRKSNDNAKPSRSSSIKNSLPKLLCLKKISTLPNEKRLAKNRRSAEDVTDNDNRGGTGAASMNAPQENKPSCSGTTAASGEDGAPRRSRTSFYQDVEEALSSLLWQPYEYQNKQTRSYSSSSCSSISSCGLDYHQNNGPGASPYGCGNYGDPEMVNKPTSVPKNLLGQWESAAVSRGAPLASFPSRLTMNALASVASCSTALASRVNAVDDVVTSRDRCCYNGATRGQYSDVLYVRRGEMQPLQDSAPGLTPRNNNNNVYQNANGARNTVDNNGFGKSFSSTNLSSANVVGLPNHSRYSSVPCSTSRTQPGAPNTLQYVHARNGSEPSTLSHQYKYHNAHQSQLNLTLPPNGTIGGNHNNNNVNHQRSTSQIDQSNPLLSVHARSASVPKSMTVCKNKENVPVCGGTQQQRVNLDAAATRLNQKAQSVPPNVNSANVASQKAQSVPPLNNVSNVNVNFYRAVPVNVVSSVPTIHCLNTLSSEGNNVSNVQIMPLGSNNTPFQQQSKFHINSNTGTFQHGGTAPGNQAQIGYSTIQFPQQQNKFLQVGNNNTLVQNSATTTTCNGSTQTQVNPNLNRFEVKDFSAAPNVGTAPQFSNGFLQVASSSQTQVSTSAVPSFSTAGVTGTTQVTVHNSHTLQIPTNNQPQAQPRANASTEVRPARTFTSTEAQTDEISVAPPPDAPTREQRRRERRERRHQRRVTSATHRHGTECGTQVNDRLPDILNSHLPPPYVPVSPHSAVVPSASLPPPQVMPSRLVTGVPSHGAVLQPVVPNNVVPGALVPFPPPQMLAGQVPLVQGATPVAVQVPPPTGFRFPFPPAGFRRGRFSEEHPKGCCGILSWKPGSLRWFIALIALIAICCVLVGTALGAMRPAGRDHLTVSLLMIGVGIVLVTVSGVAWRLTSHDASTCRSMLGLGSTESVDTCSRRFVPRLPPSYGRPHHPYAAMMYPEFQYRPPPPSYQASMQEYRLRLLLLDRGSTPQIQAGLQGAVSPPPTYRSHAGSLLRAPLSSRRDATQSEYSFPPSYRSQTSSVLPQNAPDSALHSREHSLSLSESNNGDSVANVVSILGGADDSLALDTMALDTVKIDPESDMNALRMLLRDGGGEIEASKEGNLVTIVQTDDTSPVIVTVSGNSQMDNGNTVQITEIPSEMEILAHL